MSEKINIVRNERTFLIPLNEFKAVYSFISGEETRYYLGGVFLDPAQQKIVATDGHRLMSYSIPDAAHLGKDVIIKIPNIKDSVFKGKKDKCHWLYGDIDTGIIHSLVVNKSGQFISLGISKFEIIDGIFPDYNRVIPNGEFETREVWLNPRYLEDFAKIAKSMVKNGQIHISLNGVEEAISINIPTNIIEDFDYINKPTYEKMRGVLMPMRKPN